ncbi:MAG: type 4a pilus biogenesis protein PilO [Steroidobacteraceae bacterium]
MNIAEQFRQVDWNDPGRWPLLVHAVVVAASFLVLAVAFSYLFVVKEKKPELERKEKEELELRGVFREKHQKAVNLSIYEQQLADIESSFGALLRQLPGRTEVPSLLVDISQTGVAAGLDEKLFQPENEDKKDFYAELPIKIRLTGSYHEFGEFVSGIAALPRIVTLHDISIKSEKGAAFDQLTLDLTARTYRYLDEEEIAAVEAARTARDSKGRKKK